MKKKELPQPWGFISETAKVSAKGWVVIPKEIRDALGITPGDEMRFTLWPRLSEHAGRDERLHLHKAPADPVTAIRGIIKRRPGERPWTTSLLEERQVERTREEQKIRRWSKKRKTG